MNRVAVALPLLLASSALAAPRWVDKPAWPKGDTLELTWLVHPTAGSGDEMPKSPLELLATIGATTRTIDLAPQLGSLRPLNLPLCATKDRDGAYPFERGDVAKIVFYEGGAGGYIVRRAADVLTIVSWEQTDGACEGKHGALVACPRKERTIAKLHVPKRIKVVERIFEIDAKGVRQPFNCAG